MSSPRHRVSDAAGVTLLVLLATTILAGCGGGGSSSGSTAATTKAASPTGTQSTASARQGTTSTTRPATHAATTTDGASASHASSTERSSPAPGSRLLRRFAGYGNARLGTIVVRSPSVLVWSARHQGIQIFTSRGFILVSSGAPQGSIRLSRGSYRGVRVASHAGWSIELRSPPA